MSNEKADELTSEQLGKIIVAYDYGRRETIDSDIFGPLMNELAKFESSFFSGRLMRLFGLPPGSCFKLNDLVSVVALPFAHAISDNQLLKRIATYYGYVFCIEAEGLFGTQFFFVSRDGLSLVSATETFGKLAALK